MPYITLRPDLYGITSLLDFRKETAAPLCELTQTVLRGESPLSESERELIAAYVSSLNDCIFCSSAHTAATCHLPGGMATGMTPMQKDLNSLTISDKMKSLLRIAALVNESGRAVQQHDVDHAKEQGATDREIHDTVLITAVFNLYNRYVDGLQTRRPDDPAFYDALGTRITTRGYQMPQDGYHALLFKS
jgi:uncharacterized peroxidase-related enzyme